MNDYPEQDQLNALIKLDSFKLSFSEFVDHIRNCYNEDYGKIDFDGTTLRISTGGWSGNEDILSALQDNIGFWTRYWCEVHRGGLFIFKDTFSPNISQPLKR